MSTPYRLPCGNAHGAYTDRAGSVIITERPQHIIILIQHNAPLIAEVDNAGHVPAATNGPDVITGGASLVATRK